MCIFFRGCRSVVWAIRCTNRFKRGTGIGFYVFPVDRERRRHWLRVVSQDKWKPKASVRICDSHFVNCRPLKNPEDMDYVPRILFEDRKRRVNKPSVNIDQVERTANRARVEEEQHQAEVAAEVLDALSSSLHHHQVPFNDTVVQTECSSFPTLESDEVKLKATNQARM